MEWRLIIDWLADLEWPRLVPELIGKAAGFLLGFAASWFLLFRRRLKAIERLQRGDSDDLLFQAHYLQPAGDGFQLLFRSVASKLTIDDLYDNPAARDVVRGFAERATLQDPILPTEGTLGFEVLNDAVNYLAGSLATSPMERQVWLFCLTCEDRAVVRKRCIRCFAIRPADLERFADWKWCRSRVTVERPWHWYRIVALHRIAQAWHEEQQRFEQRQAQNAMPLVDDQSEHRRLVPLSLGLSAQETPIAEPYEVDWAAHLPTLERLGVTLVGAEGPAPPPSASPAEGDHPARVE